MIGFIAGVITAVVILVLGGFLFGIDPSFAELVLVVVAFAVADVVADAVRGDL